MSLKWRRIVLQKIDQLSRENHSARTSRWLEFEGKGSPQFQKPKTSTPTSSYKVVEAPQSLSSF